MSKRIQVSDNLHNLTFGSRFHMLQLRPTLELSVRSWIDWTVSDCLVNCCAMLRDVNNLIELQALIEEGCATADDYYI